MVIAIVFFAFLCSACASETLVLNEAKIHVAGANKQERTFTVTFPLKMTDVIEVGVGDKISVAFSPELLSSKKKVFAPHQSFLRLHAGSSAASSYFLAKQEKEQLIATFTPADLRKQAGSASGVHNASLLLGDPILKTQIEWLLAEIVVTAANQEDFDEAKPHKTVNTVWTVKPDINHTHKAPQKQAPIILSIFFTLLNMIPFGLFIKYIIGSEPKLSFSIWSLWFHGGIGSILILYLVFWIKLNLMQTIPVAVGLGMFTAVAGRKTLTEHALAREKTKEKVQ